MSLFNFHRTINGLNFSKNGLTSASKTIRLGKRLNLNVNTSKSGVFVSVSLPGTGLSTNPIQLLKFNGSTKSRSR